MVNKKPNDTKSKASEGLIKQVDVELVVPPGQPISYANFATVQHDSNDGNMQIGFFQVQQPFVIGSPEQKEKAFAKIDTVSAVCTHRIVISPTIAAGLANAIADQLEKSKRFQALKAEMSPASQHSRDSHG